jgi:hypothetical protein
MKNRVIPIKINVSFHIKLIPTPFSKIPLMIIMNHLAGMILLMTCKMTGILEIGKMNPESKMVGSIKPINDAIIAVCCEAEMVEIKIPNVSDVIINNTLSNPSNKRLP